MDNTQFKQIRSRLNRTQKQMAQLLGVSIKAVHSYEQGWRKIPHHVERQLFFLLYRFLNHHHNASETACWIILDCPKSRHENCPAWEFNTGDLCWFINGTCCNGRIHDTWEEKMEACRKCPVFLTQIKET